MLILMVVCCFHCHYSHMWVGIQVKEYECPGTCERMCEFVIRTMFIHACVWVVHKCKAGPNAWPLLLLVMRTESRTLILIINKTHNIILWHHVRMSTLLHQAPGFSRYKKTAKLNLDIEMALNAALRQVQTNTSDSSCSLVVTCSV